MERVAGTEWIGDQLEQRGIRLTEWHRWYLAGCSGVVYFIVVKLLSRP